MEIVYASIALSLVIAGVLFGAMKKESTISKWRNPISNHL